jgi:hypothetical protein
MNKFIIAQNFMVGRRVTDKFNEIERELFDSSTDKIIGVTMALIYQGSFIKDTLLDEIENYPLNHDEERLEALLDGFTGTDPAKHLWSVDEDGVYSLLEVPTLN